MNQKSKIVWLSLIGIVLTVAVVLLTCRTENTSGGDVREPAPGAEAGKSLSGRPKDAKSPVGRKDGDVASREDTGGDAEAEAEAEEPQTEEEKAEAAEEAKVEAFDNLTDKWMEPARNGISLKDANEFVNTLSRVPKDRQEECVQRALNLIPDENVMLLAGILMDKSVDRAIVETVFNDILNRDEAVKLPIMRQVYKDKTHPCWADVAWILDVTGEKATDNP